MATLAEDLHQLVLQSEEAQVAHIESCGRLETVEVVLLGELGVSIVVLAVRLEVLVK